MHRQLTMGAAMDNLEKATAFLDSGLGELVSPRILLQAELALEEAYVNVAHYAYPGAEGEVTLELSVDEEQRILELRLLDQGIPFNPLEESAPDLSLSSKEREVGGLGIFLVRKNMDAVLYDYQDGQNILTMRKKY